MKPRALVDLAALRTAIAERARDAERQRRQQLHDDQERRLFVLSVGPVQPLPKPAVPPLPRPLPEAVARQRMADEAAALRESLSDEFDVEALLESDEALSYRRPDIAPEVLRKLRRGAWALQAQLDLHGLRRDEARERLGEFLREAERRGLRCVRVIHGKGLGSPGKAPVLKGKVRSWLVQRSEVIAFVEARASQGGHGAVMVLLRPSPSHPGAPAQDGTPTTAPAAPRPSSRATPRRGA